MFDKPDIPDEMKQLGEFAQVKMPKFAEKVRETLVFRSGTKVFSVDMVVPV